ncbi:MAG TPA: YIP1 family protein [Gemmatimonadales bacterium]|nr:YIP1 family protein [Gemmatimonadales bacterium]
MLTHTRAEWAAVGAAQMTPRSIYLGFLLPMAALGPLATTLGTILSGGERTSLAGTYTLSVPSAILAGVLEYAFNLGAIWGLALLIDRLAPAFQAQQGRVEALKLAAFGATPYWVGGLLGLIPKLAPVGVLLGLYSLRLYSLGLPTLMRAPGDRLSSYTFAIGAGGVVLVLFASALLLLVTS